MGLLDSLSKMGVNQVSSEDMYKKEDTMPVPQQQQVAEKTEMVINEADYILAKTYECPICDAKFKSLGIKANKARQVAMDKDLRPIYEYHIEPIKYEPVTCPYCGYTVMGRYFIPLTSFQKKMVREGMGNGFVWNADPNATTVSFEEALEKIKLALATAIVKKAKPSEKAYICLKGCWLCRSYLEELERKDLDDEALKKELSDNEREFEDNAYDGFVEAMASETYPIAGMDEITLDYLIAVMALKRNRIDVSSKMVASILQSSSASTRIKDKARDLKEEIVARIKASKG